MSGLLSIGGLGTGMDTSGIIEALMNVERKPLNLMEQRQQKLKWKQQSWSEINTKLLAIKTSLGGLLDRDKLMAKKTTSADDKVVTATSSGTAASGQYQVKVLNLATQSQLRSGTGALGLGLGGKVDTTQAVNTDAARLGAKINSGTFTINGVRITINSGDYLGAGDTADAKDILGKINGSGAGVTATYDAATDKLVLTANSPGGRLDLGGGGDTSNFLSAASLLGSVRAGDTLTSTVHLGRINPAATLASANFATPVTDDGTGAGAFLINGVEITYNASTDSLNKLITRINSSTAGVVASYDSTTDRLLLRATTPGATQIMLEEKAGKGNLLTAAGLTVAAGGAQTLGENSAFTVSGFNDGNPIYRTSNSITDVIPGVTLELKAESATETTITVEQDLDTAKNVVKDFVAKFNDAMTLINTRLKEKTVNDKDKTWDDLTDAERKQGIMRGESALTDLRVKLLNVASSPVGGMSAGLNALADIGITIKVDASNLDGTSSGTLNLDEAKLEEALRESPELVADLFFRDTDSDGTWDKDADGKPTEQGVAVQLDYFLGQLTDPSSKLINGQSFKIGVVPRQQDVLTSQIDDLDDQIAAFERRMELREQYLLKQFTLMESMVSQYNSQSSWLAGQASQLAG